MGLRKRRAERARRDKLRAKGLEDFNLGLAKSVIAVAKMAKVPPEELKKFREMVQEKVVKPVIERRRRQAALVEQARKKPIQ